MSDKRKRSEEREDTNKRQRVQQTDEYIPEEFVPEDYSIEGDEGTQISTSDSSQEQQRIFEENVPEGQEEYIPEEFVPEDYGIEGTPIIPEVEPQEELTQSPTSLSEESHIQQPIYLSDLLFDETVEEILKYRDTLSAPTYMPQSFHGITMNDYNYLYERQPISYSIVDNLGKGAYGCVLKAGINKHNGFVAIKVYKLGVLAANLENLINEVMIIRKLKTSPHNHILRCFAFFKNPNNETYFLVTEFSELKDLYNVLQVNNNIGNSIWLPLDESPIRHLIRGIAEGLKHLHSCDVSHSDLLLQNVLIFWNKNTTAEQRTTPVTDVVSNYQRLVYQWIPKLADFSNSLSHKDTDPPGKIWFNTPRCCINYSAPETWSSTPGMAPFYDAISADVFSLGCCVLAMSLCSHPFQPTIEWPVDNDPHFAQKQIAFIKSCNAMKLSTDYVKHLCRHMSSQMKRVVLRLLDPNPETRLTVNQFLSDQWFTKPHSYDDIDAYKRNKSPKPSISYEY